MSEDVLSTNAWDYLQAIHRCRQFLSCR